MEIFEKKRKLFRFQFNVMKLEKQKKMSKRMNETILCM